MQQRLQICSTCRRTGDGNNLFTAENNVDVGDVPPVLQGLTLVEKILIARVNPVVSVFRIRGQQRGYSGHVMNFIQRIDGLFTRLPPRLAQLDSILLLHWQTTDGVAQSSVRSARIRAALIWLKQNNPYYRSIFIDATALDDLPQDGDIGNRLPDVGLPEDQEPNVGPDNPGEVADQNNQGQINPSCFPNLQQIDTGFLIEQNIIRRLENNQTIQGEIDMGDWPEVMRDPLNEFTTECIVCQAFPTLFPFGRGDSNAPRLRKITPHKYSKYLMHYRDGRFANDDRFPYYAFNSLARWDALNCGSVFVRQNDVGNTTAREILELANNPNRDMAGSIMYYGVNLRGTRSFWRQRIVADVPTAWYSYNLLHSFGSRLSLA